MDTNKMRAEFIGWLKTQPHVLNVGFNEVTGKFVLAEDETAWQAWQASREAVTVELPSLQCLRLNRCDYQEARDYCLKAIKAAGLKVAP